MGCFSPKLCQQRLSTSSFSVKNPCWPKRTSGSPHPTNHSNQIDLREAQTQDLWNRAQSRPWRRRCLHLKSGKLQIQWEFSQQKTGLFIRKMLSSEISNFKVFKIDGKLLELCIDGNWNVILALGRSGTLNFYTQLKHLRLTDYIPKVIIIQKQVSKYRLNANFWSRPQSWQLTHSEPPASWPLPWLPGKAPAFSREFKFINTPSYKIQAEMGNTCVYRKIDKSYVCICICGGAQIHLHTAYHSQCSENLQNLPARTSRDLKKQSCLRHLWHTPNLVLERLQRSQSRRPSYTR